MIVFGVSGLIIAYYLGYLFGFKNGVKSIIEELNKISKDFLDKTKELKKEVNRTKEFVDFLPTSEWGKFGYGYKGEEEYIPKEWTEENIIAQLKVDLDFAIEKATNLRGISSSLMYDVLKSWCIVLENGLEDTEYGWYGDKLIKAVDEYYGFGLYKADDFIGGRLSHVKDTIMTAMNDEGYKITEFLTDGIVIDADGVGSVKITIERTD